MPKQAKRLPTSADFPQNLVASVVAPPNGQPPTNILVLLHGLGDSQEPFENLARQLQLPHTGCIALRAPNALPFEQGSFHWGDDLIFDSSTNGLDPDGGFRQANILLSEVFIGDVLVKKCNYVPRDIILFGLGQGGMSALNTAFSDGRDFGGVVSIGGPLPAQTTSSSDVASKTPVLLSYGRDSPWMTTGAIERVKQKFEHVELSQYKRKGDTMPREREEMLPIMRFLASRLRAPAPEGTVELT